MAYPVEAPLVSIYRGDRASFHGYTVKDELGVPRDLTSYTDWSAQWRSTTDSSISLDLELDLTQLAVGHFEVAAPGSITKLMPGDGGWDVQALPLGDADNPRTFAYGRTSIGGDFTRG